MVEVKYVDGDEDTFETKNSINAPWQYQEKEQCFLIPSIEGDVLIPAAFIKCLRHYEVEK